MWCSQCAVDVDVLEHDDVVVTMHFVERTREILGRVLVIAREPFRESVDHARRRIDQAFAVGIVARPGDQCANRFHRLFARGAFGRGDYDRPRLGCAIHPWKSSSEGRRSSREGSGDPDTRT